MEFSGAGEGSFSAGSQERFWVWKKPCSTVLAKFYDPNMYDTYIRKNNALYLSKLWYIISLGGNLLLKRTKRTAILLLSPTDPTEVNTVNAEIILFF